MMSVFKTKNKVKCLQLHFLGLPQPGQWRTYTEEHHDGSPGEVILQYKFHK